MRAMTKGRPWKKTVMHPWRLAPTRMKISRNKGGIELSPWMRDGYCVWRGPRCGPKGIVIELKLLRFARISICTSTLKEHVLHMMETQFKGRRAILCSFILKPWMRCIIYLSLAENNTLNRAVQRIINFLPLGSFTTLPLVAKTWLILSPNMLVIAEDREC